VIEIRDDEGRPWRLALTVAAAMRVRDMVRVEVATVDGDDDGKPATVRKSVPFDIADVTAIGQTFQILRSQFVTVGEVLYAILSAQVDEKGLTKEQFLEGLRGDSLDAARAGLESELADFFPQRLRRMVRLLSAKMETVSAEMLDRAEAQMAGATAESLTGAPSGMPSGKPPESSAYTPASGLSDNLPQPAMLV
jgi:hypothetical protein